MSVGYWVLGLLVAILAVLVSIFGFGMTSFLNLLLIYMAAGTTTFLAFAALNLFFDAHRSPEQDSKHRSPARD